MNTKQKTKAQAESEVIPVEKSIGTLTDVAWAITISCIWPYRVFPLNEYFVCRKYISRYFNNEADPFKKFQEFCFAVFLARERFMLNPSEGVTDLPRIWLNQQNKHGLKKWVLYFRSLDEGQQKRGVFHPALKAIPGAMLELMVDGRRSTFQYWRKWFIKKDAFEEYQLFYSCFVAEMYTC